jgi:thymidylate synthase (FAD)
MRVNLISVSTPVGELADILKSADLVAYMARVSNPENQANTKTAPKLLKYLQENYHWSPFEMVSATMEITTTRDISRQILRHRSFSFQEFSGRYAAYEGLVEPREARLQDLANRQNSLDNTNPELQRLWEYQQREVAKAAERAYKWALDNGLAKEVARVVLPEGLTPTTMYMAGTLRSWIHYIELRSANGTQKEHREIALACARALAEEGLYGKGF